MAGKASKGAEPTTGIVAVDKLDQNGKTVSGPHYAAAGTKWVREGLKDGTVKLTEEVPDAAKVPAHGDAAGAKPAG